MPAKTTSDALMNRSIHMANDSGSSRPARISTRRTALRFCAFFETFVKVLVAFAVDDVRRLVGAVDPFADAGAVLAAAAAADGHLHNGGARSDGTEQQKKDNHPQQAPQYYPTQGGRTVKTECRLSVCAFCLKFEGRPIFSGNMSVVSLSSVTLLLLLWCNVTLVVAHMYLKFPPARRQANGGIKGAVRRARACVVVPHAHCSCTCATCPQYPCGNNAADQFHVNGAVVTTLAPGRQVCVDVGACRAHAGPLAACARRH